MSTRRESPLSENWIPSHQCSLDLRLEILGGLPFFNLLPEDEIPHINRAFVERGYEAGGMLIHEISVMVVILNGMRLLQL